MRTILEEVAARDYPGRAIMVGQTSSGVYDLVAYILTGRSASSQARRLVVDNFNTVHVTATDPSVLAAGNPALLLYPAIATNKSGCILSNGAQTNLIYTSLRRNNKNVSSRQVLEDAFSVPHWLLDPTNGFVDITSFEPDAPNNTPRISACLSNHDDAAFSIIRRTPSGDADRQFYSMQVRPGRGLFVSTYDGDNINPLPSFVGGPVPVDLPAVGPESLAISLYNTLRPEYRVAVAVGFRNRSSGHITYAIKNLHGDGK